VHGAIHDALLAADWVAARCAGVTLAQFAEDDTLHLAVERQLEIVGEALSRAERADSSIGQVVPDLYRIIGLRNVLAHGYDVVDPSAIYLIATTQASELADTLRRLPGMEGTE
jgi:uncharacterized protein with HEPN domain